MAAPTRPKSACALRLLPGIEREAVFHFLQLAVTCRRIAVREYGWAGGGRLPRSRTAATLALRLTLAQDKKFIALNAPAQLEGLVALVGGSGPTRRKGPPGPPDASLALGAVAAAAVMWEGSHEDEE